MTQINKWIWFLFTILELPSNLSFPILIIESPTEKSDLQPRCNKSNTNQMAAVRIKAYAFLTYEILDDHEILIMMMYKVFASNSSILQCWRTSLWVWTKNFLYNDGYTTTNKQRKSCTYHLEEIKPFCSWIESFLFCVFNDNSLIFAGDGSRCCNQWMTFWMKLET